MKAESMTIFTKQVFLVTCVLGLAGCGSAPHNSLRPGRFVLDNSARGGELPAWVTSGQVAWDQGDSMFFKSTYTVGANQRVNGCYDLAKLELKESLLSELSQDIKGELNLGSEGISEGLDPLVTKSIRTNIEGTVKGPQDARANFLRDMLSPMSNGSIAMSRP
ncbi:MAG: hypothetical protein IPK04_15410 [Bdellovibrionales bacterium]|nr:hypothetical protein [Bdellovibrionales bacterium]